MTSKVFYVLLYVSIWAIHSLLIKLSQLPHPDPIDGSKYPFDIWVMALNTELAKLLLSLGYLCFRKEATQGPVQALKDLYAQSHMAKWFIIPAGIYCIANILMFVNLRLVAVPTYRILINCRVICSGLLLQQVFHKRLTPMQWLALIILIFGCTVEQLGSFSLEQGGVMALALILLQGLCSSLGGVYFQWLLQHNTGAQDIGLVEKNIFLYSCMSAMNFLYIITMQSGVLNGERFWRNFDSKVLPIILFGSFGGFTTSLLLRYLDVVAKEYANSLEMVVVYFASSYLFNTSLSLLMGISIVLVIVSVMMYTFEDIRKTEMEKAKVAEANVDASSTEKPQLVPSMLASSSSAFSTLSPLSSLASEKLTDEHGNALHPGARVVNSFHTEQSEVIKRV